MSVKIPKPVVTETKGSNPKTSDKSRSNPNKNRTTSKFGSRFSGHLRPTLEKETIGRKYFDDEETPKTRKLANWRKRLFLTT